MPRWIRCSSVSTSRIDFTGAGHTGGLQVPHQLGAGAGPGAGRHLFVDGVDVGDPVRPFTEPGVVDQLGPAECGATPRQCRSEMQMIASQPSLVS